MQKKQLLTTHKTLIVATILVLTLGTLVYLVTQQPPQNGVSVKQAQQLISNGALPIDLRSYGEYMAGHIEDAVNIPYDDCWACFEEVIGTFPKDQVFLLYQHQGHEISQSVSLQAKVIGFTQVYFLIGGYQEWVSEQR